MKTVITDLDGTLLTDGYVPEQAIDILKEFQRENRLVLATGRNFQHVQDIIAQLEMDEFQTGALILVNGLSFFDFYDQEWRYQPVLKHRDVKKIIRVAYLLFFRVTVVTKKQRIQLNCLYDRIYYLLRYFIKRKPMISFPKKTIDGEVEKIELGGSVCFDFFYKILKNVLRSYEVVKVSRYWLEILPKGTNKVNMVDYLVMKYHISQEDLFVFGDGENDIDMLKYAKNSFAPQNALMKAKDVAKNICPSCYDLGVVEMIERITKESIGLNDDGINR